MSYYLYKLRFSTPVHIGDSRLASGLESAQLNLCADTLFSALCHTILRMDGVTGLDAFVDKVRTSGILLSDTFPYKQDTLYIPKPYMPSRTNGEVDLSKRKLMKKLSYIPLNLLHEFLHSVSGTGEFDPASVDNEFAAVSVDTKVNLSEEISRPYAVAGISFYEGCGLYGIIKAGEDDFNYLVRVLRILGLNGIGGKVSSGYGKFELFEYVKIDDSENHQHQLLKSLLEKGDAECYISLTTALPTDAELEQAVKGATYQLIRRGGFIYSTALEKPLKKQTQYCFSAGSVFQSRFSGDIFNVAVNAPHPVYRYLKPLFLGVNV